MLAGSNRPKGGLGVAECHAASSDVAVVLWQCLPSTVHDASMTALFGQVRDTEGKGQYVAGPVVLEESFGPVGHAALALFAFVCLVCDGEGTSWARTFRPDV